MHRLVCRALGGIDSLVFAGGIGENCRDDSCAHLRRSRFLGIALSDERNARNAAVISGDTGRSLVRVIRTDEESVIARSTIQLLEARSARRQHR